MDVGSEEHDYLAMFLRFLHGDVDRDEEPASD